jgi:putative restriction endonuclease
MKEGQRLWTRDELILAINLYCKLTFGRLHRLNPDVIDLANLINRTPNSVAFKLVNFASLDPSLKARGIKGASNASKADNEIWNEFFNNIDVLSYESEKLLAQFKQTTVEQLHQIPEDELLKEGKTREQIVKVRVNQSFFRSSILAAYNNTCCITGINKPEFLIAGHIRPWGIDEKNRLNPRNGIAINSLHDKAFETGYITITPDYKVKVSPLILKNKNQHTLDFFGKFDNQPIILPSRFLPDIEFLKYHNEERFKI